MEVWSANRSIVDCLDGQKVQTAAANDSTTDQTQANLPLRAYLDKTVVPILLQAMSECAKERPQYPVEYIANYLLQNNPEKREWVITIDNPTVDLTHLSLRQYSRVQMRARDAVAVVQVINTVNLK